MFRNLMSRLAARIKIQRIHRSGRHFVPALLMTLMFACASAAPPPDRELQAAESAITSAEQLRVADYAAPELNQARLKLAAARVAVQDNDMTGARRLADESRVSAELASAKAEMIKARTVNEEMSASINILREEMQRNTGVRP